MDELLRDRLRRAVGNLPDAAHVTLSVRDVRACLEALEDLEAAEEQVRANANAYEQGHNEGYAAGRDEAAA